MSGGGANVRTPRDQVSGASCVCTRYIYATHPGLGLRHRGRSRGRGSFPVAVICRVRRAVSETVYDRGGATRSASGEAGYFIIQTQQLY